MLKVTFHPNAWYFERKFPLFNHHLETQKTQILLTKSTTRFSTSIFRSPSDSWVQQEASLLPGLSCCAGSANQPSLHLDHHGRGGCFNEKRRGNTHVGNTGGPGCVCVFWPWNWIIFPGVLVIIFVSNYFASYIHCVLPIMCFISCLHHVSKNPLICAI